MVSRDWTEQRIHECIVASPFRFCPDLNLGLHAIKLTAAPTNRGKPHPTKAEPHHLFGLLCSSTAFAWMSRSSGLPLRGAAKRRGPPVSGPS